LNTLSILFSELYAWDFEIKGNDLVGENSYPEYHTFHYEFDIACVFQGEIKGNWLVNVDTFKAFTLFSKDSEEPFDSIHNTPLHS